MADSDPTPTGAITAHHTSASTSSTPPAESQSADPITALGERILAELEDPGTNNTLVRWLAHHTARLVDAANRAQEARDPDAGARADAARDAILQLWRARATWPSGWPPPRAAQIAEVLEGLPALDDDGGWYRPTALALLQDLHHHVLAALIDLVAGDGSAEIERSWLNAFGDQLTAAEVSLLRRAATRPQRLDDLLRWGNRETRRHAAWLAGDDSTDVDRDTSPIPPAHPLIELADAYRATILSLFDRATGVREVGASDEDDIGQP